MKRAKARARVRRAEARARVKGIEVLVWETGIALEVIIAYYA